MTITRGSSLIIGNKTGESAFAADLAPDVTGWTISPTLNTAGDATVGIEFVQIARTSWRRQIDVASMYEGDLGDMVTSNSRKGVVIARAPDGRWVGGDYTTDGPDRSGPSDGLLTSSFSFMPTDDWVTGDTSRLHTLAGNGAANFDLLASTDAEAVAWLVVLKQDAGVTLSSKVGAAAAVEVPGDGPRIVPVTVGAATLNISKTGNGEVVVFGFIGTVEAVNE